MVIKYLYCGSSTNNIKKVNLTDFSLIDTLNIGQRGHALAVHDGYLYCGSASTNNIQKVNLTDFSTIDTLNIGQVCLEYDGYLYCGSRSLFQY